MAEFAIEFLLSRRGTARQLIAVLAERWPTRPALELMLVMSLAANGIEDMLSGDTAAQITLDTWRMAALLGVDLFDAQSLGLPHHSAADLLAYWRGHDPYFLNG
jgi:hypothetical protein